MISLRTDLGNTYQIYTEMVPGGLYSTYLHLHAKDDEQSELASAKAWHCNDASVTPSGPGASCMIWACTATGEYSLRVQQHMGSGAFNVGIKDHGPIQAIAEQEGLAPQIAEVPDKGVYLENWSIDVATHCDLVYCTFTDGNERLLTSDGERIVMAISGRALATYTFNFELQGDTPASYVKLAASPRTAQGGGNAFAGNPDMMREIRLGTWIETIPSHHPFVEYNPEYDIKEYHTFPGEEDATTGHWKWVCPADGDYFITITSNCDEAIMDDVEANLEGGQPSEGSASCEARWSMSLHVEEEATELTVPIVVVTTPDVAAANSPAQQVAATEAAVAHPPAAENLNQVVSTPVEEVTEEAASSLCQLPVDLACGAGLEIACEQPDPALMEMCAQQVMAFPQARPLLPLLPPRNEGLAPLPPLSALQPADDGGHRRLQRGSGAQDQPAASLTHVSVQHIQIRAPNREIIEQRHQEMQRHSCMRHGLRQHECPGAHGHHGGRSGRRRLETAGRHGLSWDEEMDIVQQTAESQGRRQLLQAHGRAAKAEQELLEVRRQLAQVTKERDALLLQQQ